MGYGLWVVGYGLWVMGYGLWVMGYGLWVWQQWNPPPAAGTDVPFSLV